MGFLIRFFNEGIKFTLKNKPGIRKWLEDVIREENKNLSYINIIFCSDEVLLVLNKNYLDHETLTDILTFPYQENDKMVSGDIFISIDRVRENATEFGQDFEKEVKRVMVHGVLHLIGYSDHRKKEKVIMTDREDYYLALF